MVSVEHEPTIVLLNPPPFRIAEEWDTPKYLSIGLGYIAAALHKSGYSKVLPIDAKFERLSMQETTDRILSFDPDIVGMTGLIIDAVQNQMIARELKQRKPDTTIIAGGVHVSILPETSLEESPETDFIVINEGEHTLPRLVRALMDGSEPLAAIPNLCFRDTGGITRTQAADWIENLDELAFPAWDLFPPASQYPMVTSRGCPFACKFCHPFGKHVRQRSVDNVLAEMKCLIEKHHPEFLIMFDETFGLNPKRTSELLDGFIAMGVAEKLPWYAALRISTTTPDLMEHMYRAGCRTVAFGIEGAAERVLREKKLDVKKAKQLIDLGKELGMEVDTFFIFGHPDETLFEMRKTVQLAAHLNPTLAVFGIMTPYPGTEIHELARQGMAGYQLTAKTWNDYGKHIGNALKFTKVGNFNVEIIRIIAYLYLYIYNFRFLDLMKFFRSYWKTALGVLQNVIRSRI